MGLFDWFRRKKKSVPPPLPPAGWPNPPARVPPAQSPVQPISIVPRGGFFQANQVQQPQSPERRYIHREESKNLDLGPFAPISQDELKAKAGKLKNEWSNLVAFGRSNRIPPATDPRTNLIDRAMVAQGLLSPQELAEIHQVGEAYDAVRPDVYLELAKVGQVAGRSDEERAARKEQKRAEAAERKKRRAEDVAHRKATGIIFLGRGVSTQLHDRTSDTNKLEQLGLPVLSTPADLAAAMGLTIPRLRWLAFYSEASTLTHYVRFQVKKRSGGLRTLAAPHEDLAAA